MLGIRCFQGRAIDLWCGESEEFEVDYMTSSDVEDAFSFLQTTPVAHLAFAPYQSENKFDVDVFFEELKQKLSTYDVGNPLRRVTIIADDLLHYERLQEALYRHFEELPWEPNA